MAKDNKFFGFLDFNHIDNISKTANITAIGTFIHARRLFVNKQSSTPCPWINISLNLWSFTGLNRAIVSHNKLDQHDDDQEKLFIASRNILNTSQAFLTVISLCSWALARNPLFTRATSLTSLLLSSANNSTHAFYNTEKPSIIDYLDQSYYWTNIVGLASSIPSKGIYTPIENFLLKYFKKIPYQKMEIGSYLGWGLCAVPNAISVTYSAYKNDVSFGLKEFIADMGALFGIATVRAAQMAVKHHKPLYLTGQLSLLALGFAGISKEVGFNSEKGSWVRKITKSCSEIGNNR
jgi:hypothetical protein